MVQLCVSPYLVMFVAEHNIISERKLESECPSSYLTTSTDIWTVQAHQMFVSESESRCLEFLASCYDWQF
jgi:hypothetical protein